MERVLDQAGLDRRNRPLDGGSKPVGGGGGRLVGRGGGGEQEDREEGGEDRPGEHESSFGERVNREDVNGCE